MLAQFAIGSHPGTSAPASTCLSSRLVPVSARAPGRVALQELTGAMGRRGRYRFTAGPSGQLSEPARVRAGVGSVGASEIAVGVDVGSGTWEKTLWPDPRLDQWE